MALLRPSRQPDFYITQEALDRIRGNEGDLQLQDLPPTDAEGVRTFLGQRDAIGVLSSGYLSHQTSDDQIAGLDFFRLEPEEKRQKHEPPINVYHFYVGRNCDESGKYPVWRCRGSEKSNHWMSESQFYFLIDDLPNNSS